MANGLLNLNAQRALVQLTGTVVGVVAVVGLYWGQSILIPVALAAYLTFLLNPFVTLLHHRGLGRTPAVYLVVCIAALGLGSTGWLVTTQISSLLRDLPRYTQNLKEKARSIREVAGRSSGLVTMFADVSNELGGSPAAGGRFNRDRDDSLGQAAGPTTVVLEPQSPVWLNRIATFLSPLMGYLGELALALVLVILMLQKREELRNRIIRLAGQGRIVPTTKFVEEAGQRISRFLLLQAVVNGTFGLIIGLGLLAIGVKYALLWGFLAAMFRYLPFIGFLLAAALPTCLSLALFDGWEGTLMVAGLFLSLELVVANFVEPWLYHQSVGAFEIAMLVAAAFWAFLWGPIGLVLSSPLTACLVMLGRYVPQLEFLAVLLGDEPALDPRTSFYQRLLARDQDEAENLILERLTADSSDQVYDAMLVPALSATKESRERGDISNAEEVYVLESIREIVEDVDERQAAPPTATDGDDQSNLPITDSCQPTISLFGCPARDEADALALEMLRKLLDPQCWQVELIAPQSLTAELVARVRAQEPAVVCVAAIAPGGLAHTRYLCKRLRAQFPGLKIIVYRGGLDDGTDRNSGQLVEAGADSVTTTLLETRQSLASLQPVLAHAQRRDTSASRSTVRSGLLKRDRMVPSSGHRNKAVTPPSP